MGALETLSLRRKAKMKPEYPQWSQDTCRERLAALYKACEMAPDKAQWMKQVFADDLARWYFDAIERLKDDPIGVGCVEYGMRVMYKVWEEFDPASAVEWSQPRIESDGFAGLDEVDGFAGVA